MHRFQLHPNQQGYRWVFTINNFTDADIKAIEEATVNFLVYGREHLTEGTPHIQGYVEFPCKKRLSTVCKALGGRAHCEVANGTAGENIEYCTKEKNYWMTDKELEASYKFYDDHPLPDYWTKQEKYEWKLTSNHENWNEKDLAFYIKEHDKFTNHLLTTYPDKTRTQLYKTSWYDQENKNYHITELELELE